MMALLASMTPVVDTTLAGCIVRWTGVVDGQRIDLDTCKLKEPESPKTSLKKIIWWHYNHNNITYNQFQDV